MMQVRFATAKEFKLSWSSSVTAGEDPWPKAAGSPLWGKKCEEVGGCPIHRISMSARRRIMWLCGPD